MYCKYVVMFNQMAAWKMGHLENLEHMNGCTVYE